MEQLLTASHYLPIGTTILSALFSVEIIRRYLHRPESLHLLWWGIGVITYGAGTLLESAMTLFGWHVVLFKAWYISGALLGGAPLAIGTIFLLLGKRAGMIAVWLLVATVAVTSVFVILSPVDLSLVEGRVPNSKVLLWQQIRMVSPFINGLAALFLVGGAIYSAIRYLQKTELQHRMQGNLLIALGGILPGVGGAYSRMGHTEALYIGEFVGLILIWIGYRLCQRVS